MDTAVSLEGEVRRLRRQRTAFAVGAVLALLLSVGSSLPRRLKNYHELKKANEELLSLQGTVAGRQNQIRDVQTQILKVQDEIKALQRR